MANTPVEVVPFNVKESTKDSYTSFISSLRGKLSGKAGKKIRDRPILDGQTGEEKPPPRWIHVELTSGTMKPKVAIRSDNGYIVGFTNRQGEWFQLKKKGKGQTNILLPNATVLAFSGDYEALIGDPVAKLPELALGRESTVGAISVLWSRKKTTTKPKVADVEQGRGHHDIVADFQHSGDEDATITGFANDNNNIVGDQHSGDGDAMINGFATVDNNIGDDDATIIGFANDPDRSLRRAVAMLAVTLCEAARLIPVHDTISKDWTSKQGPAVTVPQAKYIKKWGQLSEALHGWAAQGFKNDQEWFRYLKDSTGIRTGDQALKVMHLILNNPPKPKNGLANAEEGGPTGAGDE